VRLLQQGAVEPHSQSDSGSKDAPLPAATGVHATRRAAGTAAADLVCPGLECVPRLGACGCVGVGLYSVPLHTALRPALHIRARLKHLHCGGGVTAAGGATLQHLQLQRLLFPWPGLCPTLAVSLPCITPTSLRMGLLAHGCCACLHTAVAQRRNRKERHAASPRQTSRGDLPNICVHACMRRNTHAAQCGATC
jgi:hypothetical protein